MKFLGPSVGTTQPTAYDKVAVANYDLPEYYKGKNLFIRDTIDGFLVLTSNLTYSDIF